MSHAPLHGVLDHLRSLRDSQALREMDDGQLLKRFAQGHEEPSFAALVRRHGPMVWSVSRRILAREQDAEDVFQAAFLLLARNARSIRKAQSVGCWLHGVARRLALKTRLQQTRRLSREKQAADMRKNEPKSDPSMSDVRATLDTALAELPEKYRAVLVLCYLEGKTQDETARQLACPLATVRTRVARGRKLLRDRLAKQGLELSTAGLGALLIASAAGAAPGALVQKTAKAGLAFAAGHSAAALCSQQTATLVEGGLKAMLITKAKLAITVVFAVGLSGAAVWAQRMPVTHGSVQPSVAMRAVPLAGDIKPSAIESKSPAVDEKAQVEFSGRVLAPDGRGVAGANLYLSVGAGYLQNPLPSPVYGTTGADGRFHFIVPKAKFREYYVIAAAAPNYGPAWANIPRGRKKPDFTLRLVNDDVPITGQIVDLEGKPVAGATLTVMQINAGPGEDLDLWLQALKSKKHKFYETLHRFLGSYTIALCPQVTTDAGGRFSLTGIGRNRVVWAHLHGPTIASERFQIITRPGKTLEVTESEGRPNEGSPPRITMFYGASFRHVVAPCRAISGVVRDKDTKQPLAGVSIRSSKLANNELHYMQGQEIVQTTTDTQGRYRLTGMPKGKGNMIRVMPRDDQPYVTVNADVPNPPGIEPVQLDIDLKRGIWIEGRVTDKVTGIPCPEGAVEYLPMGDNPNLPRDYQFDIWAKRAIQKDGSYRIAGLPGAGYIGVWYHRKPYLRCNSRDDEFGVKKQHLETYALVITSNYSALARIHAAKGVESIRRDVTLDPGWRFKGTVLGPAGKHLTGAQCFDLNRFNDWEHDWLKTAEFAGWFNPHDPHEVLFRHAEKGLAGVVFPPKKSGEAVTVQLRPGAEVSGRLVDAEGKSRAGVELAVQFKKKGWGGWFHFFPEAIMTDPEGRFRITALLPGYEYRLSEDQSEMQFGPELRHGQTTDLGDVRLKLE